MVLAEVLFLFQNIFYTEKSERAPNPHIKDPYADAVHIFLHIVKLSSGDKIKKRVSISNTYTSQEPLIWQVDTIIYLSQDNNQASNIL